MSICLGLELYSTRAGTIPRVYIDDNVIAMLLPPTCPSLTFL